MIRLLVVLVLLIVGSAASAIFLAVLISSFVGTALEGVLFLLFIVLYSSFSILAISALCDEWLD